MRLIGGIMSRQLREHAKAKRRKRLHAYASEMRRKPTAAESRLWDELGTHETYFGKWMTQVVFDRFILDFYNRRARLCIEVDGGYHAEFDQHQRDLDRDRELQRRGVLTLRFTNEAVFSRLRQILISIHHAVRERTPKPKLAQLSREQRQAMRAKAKANARRQRIETIEARRSKATRSRLPWEEP